MIELSITVKDEERTLTKKFTIYDVLILSLESEALKDLVQEVVKEFGGDLENDAPKITVRAVLVYQD